MQEKDYQDSDADSIKYQLSLASAEAAGKLRNSAARTKGTPKDEVRWNLSNAEG
jgi:hypothetical protein